MLVNCRVCFNAKAGGIYSNHPAVKRSGRIAFVHEWCWLLAVGMSISGHDVAHGNECVCSLFQSNDHMVSMFRHPTCWY